MELDIMTSKDILDTALEKQTGNKTNIYLYLQVIITRMRKALKLKQGKKKFNKKPITL